MDELQARVYRLERALKPASCRVSEEDESAKLYYELIAEHGWFMEQARPKKKKVSLHKFGHPRWF